MSEFQQKLEKYAKLAVEVGVNIQKDQTLSHKCHIGRARFCSLSC